MNSSQVLILKALAKSRTPLSVEEIEKRSKASASPVNLGPTHKSTLEEGNGKYAGSLFGLGMVQPVYREGDPTTWTVTDKGKKAAGTYETRAKRTSSLVPMGMLSSSVLKFRTTRTYGFEDYTDSDLAEIRSSLSDTHKGIPLNELRQQMVTLRKRGAFVDPEDRVRRAALLALNAFGPSGKVRKGLFDEKTVETLTRLSK